MASLRNCLALVATSAIALTLFAPPGAAAPDTAETAGAGTQGRHHDHDPRVPNIPQRYLDQPVQWSTCSFDATIKNLYPAAPTTNCAIVMVPMDWNNPDAHPDIRVAIALSRATGTSRGVMTSNPGGPGGAGLSFTANLAVQQPQLFAEYDLLGFDPRGFGRSEPLQCLTTTEKLDALPTTPDYRQRDAQTHRTEIAEARLFAEACSATEFGQFVSSQQTVYDMEFLRALMGQRLLNFIGYSYGTWLGGWYADTYPQRVGRFVNDSNMDWTHTQWDNVNFDPFSYQRRFDTQFLPWIARHADQITPSLGTTPQQVQARYTHVRGELMRMLMAGTSDVRGDNFDFAILGVIGNNTRFVRALLDFLVHDEYVRAPGTTGSFTVAHVDGAWARLAPALQQFDTLAAIRARYGVSAAAATSVDSSAGMALTRAGIIAQARSDAALSRASGDAVVNLGAIGTTVRCNDTAWNDDPRFYTREADRMTRKYPWGGYLNGVPFCAFWPHAPQDRTLDLPGSPRMLMVHSELDPQTAYEGGLRTHRDVPMATRLVSVDDEGQHGQYLLGPSACVDAIGDRFVFGGELPGRDQVCGTSPLPGDGAVYSVRGPLDGNSVPLPRSSSSGAKRLNSGLQSLVDEVSRHSLI
jgi:pimeloyl-ACP methyl ester carboxylesterase